MCFPHKNRFARLLATVLTPIVLHANVALAEYNWQQARNDYQVALKTLEKRDFNSYRMLRKKLTHYPLYPYLEYQYLHQRFSTLSITTAEAQLAAFLTIGSSTPLAGPIKHQWLKRLATSRQWPQYLNHFDSQTKSTELHCYALWAQHKIGQTEQAFDRVAEFWLVGKSQPDACNPIFALWIKNNRLTDSMAWQRFTNAMQANNSKFARYLIRFMSPKDQALGKLYRQIYRYPEQLKKISQFKSFNAKHRDVVLHGFKRLARKNSLLAYQLWPKYQTTQHFNAQQSTLINRHIMLFLAHQNNSQIYQEALQRYSSYVKDETFEAGIRLAIRQQDWPLIISLTQQLSAAAINNTHSQYWLRRAQFKTGIITRETLQKYLHALAQQRDYYSFLAADYLQQPYQMNAQRYPIDSDFLARFKQRSSIIRARELLHSKQVIEARREWHQATLDFNKTQHYTAAYYAQELGWSSQAILSASKAKRWHDLQLRFPLSFEKIIILAAKKQPSTSNLLLAMARQESALAPGAVSPKGARGLIQMMPTTASHVARKHKIAYRSRQQLFDPQKNVELASAYFHSLIKQFDDNVIYAIAAYNAGPRRVKEWLKTTHRLPMDIWIESIPFKETRQYVKNVLTYRAIYAHRRQQLGIPMSHTPLLSMTIL
jgi:soluble lytic murein transglycosylase